MEQMTYTICRPGLGISKSAGFGVRAISSGLTPIHAREFVTYCGYQPPRDGGHGLSPIGAPVRMAFLDSALGRVLVHSVYAGADPTTPSRGGNIYSHLLVNLPLDWNAADAIQRWNSPLWRTCDDDGPATLPALPEFRAETGWRERLGVLNLEPTTRQQLRAILSGVLSAPPHGRIFIVGEPDDIATYIYAVAILLPLPWRKQLTFSTYEHAPLNCPARVVGTCYRGEPNSLPGRCHFDGNLAFYICSAGSDSTSPPSDYADFAIACLANDRSLALQEFQQKCEGLATEDLAILELLALLQNDKVPLSETDYCVLCQNSVGRSVLLERESAVNQLISLALHSAGFAERALKMFSRDQSQRERLATEWLRQTREAALADSIDHLYNALLVALPVLAPTAVQSLSTQLFRSIDPDKITWNARRLMLSQFRNVRFQELEHGTDDWLYVACTDLPELLALGLPEEYLAQALVSKVRVNPGDSPTIAQMIATNVQLTSRTLLGLAADAASTEIVIAFVRAAMQRNPGLRDAWLRTMPQSIWSPLIHAMLTIDPVTAFAIVRDSAFAPNQLDDSSRAVVLTALSKHLSIERMEDQKFSQNLEIWLKSSQNHDEPVLIIQAWRDVWQFGRTPTLVRLFELERQSNLLPRDIIPNLVRSSVPCLVQRLTAQGSEESFGRELTSTIEVFARHDPNGAAGIYVRLYIELRDSRYLKRRPDIVREMIRAAGRLRRNGDISENLQTVLQKAVRDLIALRRPTSGWRRLKRLFALKGRKTEDQILR